MHGELSSSKPDDGSCLLLTTEKLVAPPPNVPSISEMGAYHMLHAL